jgi:hypothetical protein
MENQIDTYFISVINSDGTITTMPDFPEGGLTKIRNVTNYDVYQTAKQIVDEFEATVLADKVARSVLQALNPDVPTVSDKVKEALKERGVNTEGA